jgi:hypothetical protein
MSAEESEQSPWQMTDEDIKKRVKEIAATAIQVQDAVNLGAIVHGWSKWCPIIREDARRREIDFNSHPINVMLSSKLTSLCGSDSASVFADAYKDVQALAESEVKS